MDNIYILLNNNSNVINISNDITIITKYFDVYVNNMINVLNDYCGDTKKFINNINKWKIVYYNNNIDCGYYYINNNFELNTSNSSLKQIKFKLLLNNKNNSNLNEINKIFIKDNDNIDCKLPNISLDDVSLIKNQNTESLINNCFDDNVSNQKIESLKENLNNLMKKKEEELKKLQLIEDKKNYELELKKRKLDAEKKRNEEKEMEYKKKYLIDRKLYFVFKDEIANKKREVNNIPILFNKQWLIFSEMEKNNEIDLTITNLEETVDTINIIQKELFVYNNLESKCDYKDINTTYAELFSNANNSKWDLYNDSDSDDNNNINSDDD
jgi:hypothetical protein